MSIKRRTKEWSKRDIDRMLKLLPIIEDRGFQVAVWPEHEPREVDGMMVHQIPYPEYHPVIDQLRDLWLNSSCYTNPYEILPEDPLGLNPDSMEAATVLTSARDMESATLNQIRRYFILCTRGEHFCDGYIGGQFRDGAFQAALARLKLLRELM